MTRIVVAKNIKTNKFYPFVYMDDGEIRITTTEPVNEDDLIVTVVDSLCLDWETNEVLKKPLRKRLESRPFYADFYN